MRGIDISHHNGWPFNKTTEQGFKDSDFVIVKATQWETSYKWEGYFSKAIKKAEDAGKLLGAYHYATGLDPVKEADHFLRVVKGYVGKALLALDWEPHDNKAWGSNSWARKFVDRIHEKTGLWPLIYTGVEGVKHCANCAPDCRLWFAGYPTEANSWTVPKWPSRYKIAPWRSFSIWQFTSGKGTLDRNTSPLTAAKWSELTGSGPAKGTPKKTVKNEIKKETFTSTKGKTTLQLALEVVQGKHGKGDARKKSLGARYSEVQTFINHVALASTLALAKEVIAGKYGNDETRKAILGRRYDEVQKRVNKLIK